MTAARMTYFLLACKILAEKTASSRGCSAAANGAKKKNASPDARRFFVDLRLLFAGGLHLSGSARPNICAGRMLAGSTTLAFRDAASVAFG
jgi:hypothetical protein